MSNNEEYIPNEDEIISEDEVDKLVTSTDEFIEDNIIDSPIVEIRLWKKRHQLMRILLLR